MDIETPPLKTLTDQQAEIVKNTWSIVNETPEESGEAIFYTFLERHPEHQKRYSAFKNTPLSELKGTMPIQIHAGKIMRAINTAINAIGTENAQESFFNSVADNADYHGRRGVKKEHYNQIRDVIVEVLSSACSLDDAGKEAWNTFLDSYYHITFNVLDELKK